MSNRSCGKPKKSWMVRGRGIAVTAVALIYQCADTTRIARGRGTDSPKARHADVYRLVSNAFMGLPCPMNAAGIVMTSSVARRVVKPRRVTPREERPGP